MRDRDLYIGLMSGTSVDSIDAALVDFSGESVKLAGHHSHPISASLKGQILALCQPGERELDRMGELDRALGRHFADAANSLLKAMALTADRIVAIGSHGQTVRHRPPGSCEHPFSLQIGDPNTIAENTGITTVADFRRRDMAAGGEGAPLAPAFHRAAFQSPAVERFVVNIGGMANVSHLPLDAQTIGFDTGPGNVLMDAWVNQNLGCGFDRDGHWALQGEVQPALLDMLLAHPFFAQSPPKSTGREAFHLPWLTATLERLEAQLSASEIQATLLELTAKTITDAILPMRTSDRSEIYVCGGGAHNLQLMSRLEKLLAPSPVASTVRLGLAPDWVEAVAFAWLARQTLNRQAGNLPSVTGAKREVILGGIYYP